MKFKLLITLAAILALAGCGTGGKSPDGIVEQIYELSADGNLEAALELLVIEKRSQREASIQKLARLRDHLIDWKFTGFEFRPHSGETEQSIRVHFAESYENGKTMDGGAQLMKEDGDWKLKSLYVPGDARGRGKHTL